MRVDKGLYVFLWVLRDISDILGKLSAVNMDKSKILNRRIP
jgi:hypothetical protein